MKIIVSDKKKKYKKIYFKTQILRTIEINSILNVRNNIKINKIQQYFIG